MKFNYSHDCELLIKSLNNFDKLEFEKWYKEKNIYITKNDYMAYLLIKENLKDYEIFKNKIKNIILDIDFEYVPELLPIIKNSNIDIEEFKKGYYLQFLTIGSNFIVIYLNDKEAKNGNK